MSEQMIFSIKAQVYILDQSTQNWSPATFSVIPVSFYWDPTNARTRIIAMENSEPKINSIILPGMSFHKPSDTFGQWLDPASNNLYGLNFTSKSDCDNFAKTFNEALEKKKGTEKTKEKDSGENIEEIKKEIITLQKKLAEKDAEAEKKMADIRTKAQSAQEALNTKIESLTSQLKILSTENEVCKSQLETYKKTSQQGSDSEVQLKKANEAIEKLKSAVAQNSANVQLWQNALQNLTQENHDLKEKVKKMSEVQQQFASLLGK